EIAFLMASEVGRFLLQKRFFVAAAIPNDALIATNILGRLCRGLVRKAFCTPELGFEKNRSFLASRTPEKKRPAQGPATNLSGLCFFPAEKKAAPPQGPQVTTGNYPMNDCAVLLVPATVRIPQKIFSESKIICEAWCWSPSAAPVQNSGRNNVPDKLFLDSRCRATMCVGEPHEA